MTMQQIIIAATVAAVVSIICNIRLARHLTCEIERYEKEMENYAKDKLEEIKKLVVDAYFGKRAP